MPNPNPKGKTYLLKGVPVDIYEAAQAKAAASIPPLSMRWVIISLLEKWVGKRPPSADAPKRVFKPRTKKPRTPKPLSNRDKYRAETRMDADAGPPTDEPVEGVAMPIWTEEQIQAKRRQETDDDADLDLTSSF